MSYNTVISIVFCGFFAIFLTADFFKETRTYVKKTLFNIQDDTMPITQPTFTTYDVLGTKRDTLYTKQELAKYDGSAGSPGLYLGILGKIYDVATGEKHYGEGGGYSFFRGRDGTKAFMTGEFNDKGLIDETTGLSYTQMLELEDWIKFYDKSYIYKGKVIGNFYNSDGDPTEALLTAIEGIKEAHVQKQEKEREKAKMPPCNAQQKEGFRRVWCTKQSGGVKRDWVGVPRMFYKQGSTFPKCVCVRTEDLSNPQIKEYENCDPHSDSCQLEPIKQKKEL